MRGKLSVSIGFLCWYLCGALQRIRLVLHGTGNGKLVPPASSEGQPCGRGVCSPRVWSSTRYMWGVVRGNIENTI